MRHPARLPQVPSFLRYLGDRHFCQRDTTTLAEVTHSRLEAAHGMRYLIGVG